MAIANEIYASTEWKFGLAAEASVGTLSSGDYQLLNLDGDVGVSTELVQLFEPKSGNGRTVKTADSITISRGGLPTTVTASITLDTITSPILHSGVLGVAVGTSPASYDLPFDYAPTGVGAGDASGDDVSFGLCLISPQSNESRYFSMMNLKSMTVTMDSSTEGGRAHANLTFESRWKPTFGQAAPTTVAYGSTFRYLRELGTTKTFGGAIVVINKVEYTIDNPTNQIGFQGSNGNPEMFTRGIPSANFSGVLGIKYDSNTALLWEVNSAGTTQSLELSNNATWASATFGIKADACKINADPNPAGTDGGVYQDISFIGTAGTSGDVVQVIP